MIIKSENKIKKKYLKKKSDLNIKIIDNEISNHNKKEISKKRSNQKDKINNKKAPPAKEAINPRDNIIRPTETISLMSQEKTAKEPPGIIKEIKNKNKQNDSPQTETRPVSTTTNNSSIIKKETTTDDIMTILPHKHQKQQF